MLMELEKGEVIYFMSVYRHDFFEAINHNKNNMRMYAIH